MLERNELCLGYDKVPNGVEFYSEDHYYGMVFSLN